MSKACIYEPLDHTFGNGLDACIEALETGQVQIAADLLKVMRLHFKANSLDSAEERSRIACIRAVGKIRRRANDTGTELHQGGQFKQGLLCAANMVEAEYRRKS